MKALFLVFGFVVALATAAEAAPRWGGGGGGFGGGGSFNPGGRPGPVNCSATDNGWEEHFGGHSNCGECTAKHGTCTERCTQEEYRCKIVGQVRDRSGNNVQQIFYGRGGSRWDAEEQAQRECNWNRASSCSLQGCETNTTVVSQRACR